MHTCHPQYIRHIVHGIYRVTHSISSTVYNHRYNTCHPQYINIFPHGIYMFPTVYLVSHRVYVLLPTAYTCSLRHIHIPTVYIWIYRGERVPHGSYIHVPHGILYTVGNISDVLYGICPRYKNVIHGISPTVYVLYTARGDNNNIWS